MSRIALVEDHERLGELIARSLLKAGIQADRFGRLDSAVHAFHGNEYAVGVIDRGLPDGDGLELVRSLRSKGNHTPFLILTARDSLHDRVTGLESGADDYLSKPFEMEELVARVRALIRRPQAVFSNSPAYCGLVVIPDRQIMSFGTESIALSPAELQIMLRLVQADGQFVRRTALEAAAWGLKDAVTPNALDVALHRLRRKLGAIDCNLRIQNIRMLGYAIVKADEAA